MVSNNENIYKSGHTQTFEINPPEEWMKLEAERVRIVLLQNQINATVEYSGNEIRMKFETAVGSLEAPALLGYESLYDEGDFTHTQEFISPPDGFKEAWLTAVQHQAQKQGANILIHFDDCDKVRIKFRNKSDLIGFMKCKARDLI